MRNLIYILHIILAMFFFSSCEDDGAIMLGDNEQPYYTILVSAPNTSDTRAYYNEDGDDIAVVWEKGDAIILSDGSREYTFVFDEMQGNNGLFFHYGDIENAGSWTGTVSFGATPGTTKQAQKKNNVCGEHLVANVTGVNLNNKPTIPLLPADNMSLLHIQTKSPGLFLGGSLLKIKGLDQNEYSVTLGDDPSLVFADAGETLDIYVVVSSGKTIANGSTLKFYFYAYDEYKSNAEDGDEFHYYMKCNGAITTANNEVVKMTLPNKPTHAAIQLGLSVKWATMNIGATSDQPGEASFGGYYPWGIPVEHYEYAWESDKSSVLMGKELAGLKIAYGTAFTLSDGFQGIPAKTYQGETIGDPATSLWGDDWGTPTKKEMEELRDCAFEATFNQWVEWANSSSVIPHVKTNGVYFKGKGNYSSKKIWFPAAGGVHTQKKGTLDNPASNDGCNGVYMTSTHSGLNGFYILSFNGKNGGTMGNVGSWSGTYDYNRNHGVSVRPVRK